MFWLVSMLIGAGIGILCDVANSKLNNRPYQFRITAGINDTPSTRRASGNVQNDNLQRLLQNKNQVVNSVVTVAQQKREQEQLVARKKTEAVSKLATGLMQLPTANRSEMVQLASSYDKKEFSRADKILAGEQHSKLLCPQKVQEFAMECVAEIVSDLLFHGTAVTVPSLDSDEFQKFRKLIRKKGNQQVC